MFDVLLVWHGITKSRSYDVCFQPISKSILGASCPKLLRVLLPVSPRCLLALAQGRERAPWRPRGTLHAGARRRRLIDRLIDRLLSAVYHAGSMRPRLQAINILLLQSLKSMENKRKSWLEQRRKQLYQTLRKPLFEISRKAFAGASGKLMQV